MTQPLLSVVVPSFNSERYLEPCLDSLKAAQDPRVEYLFLDGGSRDDTLRFLEPYRALFSHVVSEPDKGQSDAFNKGYALSSGKYLTWLNSDDVFCPGALSYALDYMECHPVSWYAANVVYVDADSRVLRCCRSGPFERWALRFGVLNVFGPSTIFSRKLYEQYGPFRDDFHYSMDTEYWWRLASGGEHFLRIPIYLWALRLHEAAKTSSAISSQYGQIPEGMLREHEISRSLYYSHVTPSISKRGKLLVRLYRCLNGSYVKSFQDTFTKKNKSLSCLCK